MSLQKAILSNVSHRGSLQWAQKVTRTQSGVTVKPYIISLIDCHPVYIKLLCAILRPLHMVFKTNGVLSSNNFQTIIMKDPVIIHS